MDEQTQLDRYAFSLNDYAVYIKELTEERKTASDEDSIAITIAIARLIDYWMWLDRRAKALAWRML